MPIRLGASLALGGAGVKPFTPLVLGSSLLAWWRADAGVTLNGSNVSAWADQSGNGKTLAQTSAASQPLYEATGLNGFSCLTFNGTSSIMSTAHLTELDGSTGMVIAASMEMTDRTNYGGVAYMRAGADGFVFDNLSGGAGSGWRFGSVAAGFAFVSSYVTSSLLPTVVSGRFASGINTIYEATTLKDTKNTSNPTIVSNAQPLYVGGRAPAFQLASVKIREMVICKTDLTNTQLANLQSYLAQQAGL